MNAATSTTSTNKPTTKDYVYRVSAAVANAILVTLGIGLLFQTIAQFIHWQPLYDAGTMGTVLLAPALGVAVASQLDVNTLVIFSAGCNRPFPFPLKLHAWRTWTQLADCTFGICCQRRWTICGLHVYWCGLASGNFRFRLPVHETGQPDRRKSA